VRVREGRGNSLRRRATSTTDGGEWSVLEVPYADDDALADEVSGFGADVVVESPPEVRDLVIRRLQGAVKAHGGAA
jgi:proteasome accessory factor B